MTTNLFAISSRGFRPADIPISPGLWINLDGIPGEPDSYMISLKDETCGFVLIDMDEAKNLLPVLEQAIQQWEKENDGGK